MKRLTTPFTLLTTLILSVTSTGLQAQTSDAPTTGECITIELSATKDKVLYAGVVAPDKDAWIDLNGDGECQPLERIGRETEAPADYIDIFYAGPELEIFALDENVQTLHIYGTIEALRLNNSETNTAPKSVDLSQCTALKYFKAYECPELEQITPPLAEHDFCEMLSIQYTPLKTLDLSNFGNLLVLVASFNKQLERITLAECPEMVELDLSFTKVAEVDLSKVPALTNLYLCQAALSSIDLSHTPNLETLSLGANHLTQIDLSSVPNLTYLSLFDNNLTAVDLSPLTELEVLELEQNRLTAIDLSKNSMLKELTIHINELSTLDLSMLSNLHLITLYDNNLSEETMGRIVPKIPQCKEFDEEGDDEHTDLWGQIYVVNTPSPRSNVCNTLHVAELKKKGWTPFDTNGGDPQDFMLDAVEYEGSTPTGLCSPIEADAIQISHTNAGVRIQDLSPRTSVSLFTTSGELLRRYNTLRSTEVYIPASRYPAGTYVVTIGNKSYKIALH